MAAKKKPETPKQNSYVFKIGFEGKPEKPIETVAYLFGRAGRLLATSPLRGGQAEFKLSEDDVKRARVFLGPAVAKERFGDRRTTLETMVRLQAHEPVWHFQRDKSVYELLPIPEVAWRWWLWCKCRVRGRVVKTVFTGGGASYEVPVCNARVHICEVDRLLFVIPRLPDRSIWRLRDDLSRLFDRPPLRIPPRPEPGPFAIPEPIPTPFAMPEPIPTPSAMPEPIPVPPSLVQAGQLARARQLVGTTLPGAAMINPQPEPSYPLRGELSAGASNPQSALPARDVAALGTDASFPEWSGKEVAFGGVLEPRVDFGTGLKSANITHYLWSYRWFGSADDADWKPINAEIRRYYRVATPPGDPVKYSSVKAGPDADGLFEIEPALPADGEDWEVLNEHYDLASARFDSSAAQWAPGVVGHGQFELKLELFRKTGATFERIDLTAEGVDLDETTSSAPFLTDEIFTGVPAADRLLRELVGGSLHVVGYKLVLLVDSRVCFGTINDVTISGVGAGPCGFLEYDPAAVPGPSAQIAFRASHPGNFAGFSFVTTRVITHLPSASAQGLVESTLVNGFGRAGGSDTFSKIVPVSILLHELEGATSCVRAAFAETLHVYALVTDGYWRLSYLDAPRPAWEDPSQIDVRAFALTPEEPAP